MTLVHEEQKILREIIQQGGGHTARRTTGQHCRVVFDALADTHLVQHLDIVVSALGNALGFDQLALGGELFDLRIALGADLFQRSGLFFRADDIVAGREDGNVLDHVLLGAGQGVELGNAVDLVPEELHPDGKLAHISQINVHRITVHPELIAHKIHVVALVLQGDQLFAQLVPLHLHSGAQTDDHAAVVDRVAQRVDAGHRCHNNNVPPLRKRRRSRVAQAVDLVVDSAVLFNIGIGAGNVGLRLVVVVVADEVLHRIVGEKRAELGTQLCRQRFVVRQHQRGAVALGNDVGHGKGFAAAGHAQQGLAAVTPLHPLHQLRDRLRLVASGGIVRHQFKFFLCHRFLPSVRITTISCCFKLYYSMHIL